MENSQKRVLLQMTYYTLIGLSIVFTIFFVLRISYSNMPLYIKIIYYIWSGVLILAVIYDIVCTLTNKMKFIVGIILFVLTILSIIMAIDVLFMQGINFKAITSVEIAYFINMSLSFAPIWLGNCAFIFGEKLIELSNLKISATM